VRFLLAVLVVASLALVTMHPWWCVSTRDEAHGQPWAPRELLQDHIETGYKKQIERLLTGLFEGYLTRPGNEKEEDEKFRRGLRVARRARERAIDMIMREPWSVVTPLPERPLPKRPSDAPRWDGPANTR
jgi:hypothetical protein